MAWHFPSKWVSFIIDCVSVFYRRVSMPLPTTRPKLPEITPIDRQSMVIKLKHPPSLYFASSKLMTFAEDVILLFTIQSKSHFSLVASWRDSSFDCAGVLLPNMPKLCRSSQNRRIRTSRNNFIKFQNCSAQKSHTYYKCLLQTLYPLGR